MLITNTILEDDNIKALRANYILLIGAATRNAPKDYKMHIDKKTLELLLFNKHTVRLSDRYEEAGKEVTVKFLAWRKGPSSDNPFEFLSKVDLSEVSFEDVMWDLYYDPLEHFEGGMWKQEYDFFRESKNPLQYPYCRKILNFYNGLREINLSNTNANIDFSKSFEGKHPTKKGKELTIAGCNFENVDLSNNSFSGHLTLEGNNFDNSGITININELESINFRDISLESTTYGINFVGSHPEYPSVAKAISDAVLSGRLEECYMNGYELRRSELINAALKRTLKKSEKNEN